jgi:hypothetical protein
MFCEIIIINDFAEIMNGKLIILQLITEAIYVIGLWIEIIYYIIHAIKHKEIKNNTLCAVLIYLFNIFYIPCYKIKNIDKDKNYKKKNIIYLIISITLYLIMFETMTIFAIKESMYETYISDDKKIAFKMPYTYYETKVGEYDAYFKNETSNIGVFLYDEKELTPEEILEHHEQEIITTRKNVKKIDSKEKKTLTKTIKTEIFEGTKDNQENIYTFTIMTFKYNPNYKAYVVEITLKEDYNKEKKELSKIIENINLNK